MKKVLKLVMLMLVIVTGMFMSSNHAIADDKEYIVGTNAEYPPFEFVEDGVIKGFDADLIELVSKKVGFKYKWANIDFAGLIPAMQTKKVDIAIAGMSVTPEREKAVNFSIGYLTSNAAILTNKINPIKGMDDLEGKSYGAEIGTTKEARAQKIKDAKVVPYSNNTGALIALISGKVDGIVMDESVAKEYYEKNKDTTIYVGALEGEPKAIAFHKDDTELRDKVSKAIQELLDDGTIQKLREKYGI
ncbi:MAG: transporter substrate-binding domain-containing protein [Fusobacteriaceae bacterium]|nr:transporter substrate-binding domain-containing protein [Fusobacteriaceae bacterium]